MVQDLPAASPQLGSNSETPVMPIRPTTAKHQSPLGVISPTPGRQLPRDLLTIVRDTLSFPARLGKDILLWTGPSPLPERFNRNLAEIARAYDPVRNRLEEMEAAFDSALEISRDPEQLDSEALLVVVRIRGMPYEEILKVWDRLSDVFARSLDTSLIGNVHLVLRSGERDLPSA